jgi:c(7)-type cytochrome triheme protein
MARKLRPDQIMRIAWLFLVLTAAAGFVVAQDVPDKIVFPSKSGNVTFNHTAHSQRAKEDCSACHPALFPQSRAPINYKAGMHKAAETTKTSCGGCHNPTGGPLNLKAFETKGNCAKCHVRK